MHVGAKYYDDTCVFSVWAPYLNQVKLYLNKQEELIALEKTGGDYWTTSLDGIPPNTLYMYQLDGKATKPDPVSHFQPNGVFGPSAVIDHSDFKWKDDDWQGLALRDLVFYELHVGTFTLEGTFKATQGRTKELSDFGINAVELLPITQFSGKRNWGYDGVFPFAVQNTYGTPNELKVLVNECHMHGIAFFLDLVYNHLGPEGNCLNDYGPYFPSDRTGRWGATVNIDGPNNAGVRNYFLENIKHWLKNYHIDGVRLDAILSMQDNSPKHFLQELTKTVKSFSKFTGKKTHLIAETGYNVPNVLTSLNQGGYGFDAQWLDDFQHALFALVTGEREGYYKDYGTVQDLVEALSEGYVYVGEPPHFKRKAPDDSYRWIPADKFIVFSQNHDQVGNRLIGDRLTTIAGFEAAKLAAGIVLLSPYVPLLFMGEEYGETAPFLFFTDYQGKELSDAVRTGRKQEFAHFHWKGEVPDPQSAEAFEKSKINWKRRYAGKEEKTASYYRTLIGLRKKLLLFHSEPGRKISHISKQDKTLFIHKKSKDATAGIVANFSSQQSSYAFPFEEGIYKKILDSSDAAWIGSGLSLPDKAAKGDLHVIQGFGFAVFVKEEKKFG